MLIRKGRELNELFQKHRDRESRLEDDIRRKVGARECVVHHSLLGDQLHIAVQVTQGAIKFDTIVTFPAAAEDKDIVAAIMLRVGRAMVDGVEKWEVEHANDSSLIV